MKRNYSNYKQYHITTTIIPHKMQEVLALSCELRLRCVVAAVAVAQPNMLLQQMLVLLVNSCKSVPLITWKKKLNPDIFSSKLENKEDKCGSGFFCMLLEDDLMEEEKKSLNIVFAERVTDFLFDLPDIQIIARRNQRKIYQAWMIS